MENIQVEIKKVIDFNNSLLKEEVLIYQNLSGFINRFKKRYDIEKESLPYHINLIDELHADENAHSRIFAKLLRFKRGNKFPILEQFLNDVCGFELTVKNPKVEKVDSCGRIDIPIFDDNYVVVIENKVTDKAPDQNTINGGQLARYIETIHEKYKRNLEDIYVVYTPKHTRTPSDECWLNKENHSYKDDFYQRFSSVSYRDNIYPWIKNDLLPTIEKKDVYLISAIEQYVDYLEGMFSKRTINEEMNKKLQDFIKKEFSINDAEPKDAIKVLSEKEKELNHTISQIEILKREYKKQEISIVFTKWREQLKECYPGLEIIGDAYKVHEDFINVGVRVTIDNLMFAAIIEYQLSQEKIYYGIGKHSVSDEKHNESEKLTSIIDKNKLANGNIHWYGKRYSGFEYIYKSLEELIDSFL